MLDQDHLVVLKPTAQKNFVESPHIKSLTTRGLAYLESGFPLHFRGPAGSGKTTLALHIASVLGRPVMLLHGDDEFGSSDLVGGQYGYRSRKVVDNFIHSVLKTEEDHVRRWVDNRLTVACKYGFTLVYDEFSRSRPEANNILLSVLEERILTLPPVRDGEDYLFVHEDFKAIFTSNPEEYAGVHKTQDALQDRMISIDLDYMDKETEVAITQAKSGISKSGAGKITEIVRDFREQSEAHTQPTLRASIMIAKACNQQKARISCDNPVFRQTCLDVLAPGRIKNGEIALKQERHALIDELIGKYCNGKMPVSAKSRGPLPKVVV